MCASATTPSRSRLEDCAIKCAPVSTTTFCVRHVDYDIACTTLKTRCVSNMCRALLNIRQAPHTYFAQHQTPCDVCCALLHTMKCRTSHRALLEYCALFCALLKRCALCRAPLNTAHCVAHSFKRCALCCALLSAVLHAAHC